MYTQDTLNMLEALRENEKRLRAQNKEVKQLINNWNKAFKKLFKL